MKRYETINLSFCIVLNDKFIDRTGPKLYDIVNQIMGIHFYWVSFHSQLQTAYSFRVLHCCAVFCINAQLSGLNVFHCLESMAVSYISLTVSK